MKPLSSTPRPLNASAAARLSRPRTPVPDRRWTCASLRDWLEARVVERLDQPIAEVGGPPSQTLDPATTVIALDVGPYPTVQAADAAEGAIDWFARTPDALARQRACRLAFAALELQRYLRRMTGDATGFAFEPAAQRSAATELRIEFDGASACTDGRFEIVGTPRGFVLRGLSIQGCLYAVYDYLEQLGCAFLEPGEAGEVIPRGPVAPPRPTRQTPSFCWRRLHGWRKNRATPTLLDWMGKARINVWGADNLVPGMRKRGILLASGMHDILPVVGLEDDFNILDADDRRQLAEGIVHAFAEGPYTAADICEYIGADWGRRPDVDFAGNATDLELLALHTVRDALRRAYAEGRINRDVFVSGYAYFDSEEPPALPMPEGFDGERIAVEFWSMRCWDHLLDEPACAEDFPIVAKMKHYAGQVMAMPSNRRIHDRLCGWAQARAFTGRLGVGHYISNAGNFFMPLGLSAVLGYEMPMLHRLGVRQINYMHISADDWGPKALTNRLYQKLAWRADADPVALIAGYFAARFGGAASTMARAYFEMERATSQLPVLKRFVVNWLSSRGSLAPVAGHSHVRGLLPADGDAGRLARACAQVEHALRLAETAGGEAAQRDRRWMRYALQTLELFRLTVEAVALQDRGDLQAVADRLREAAGVVEALRSMDLKLHLPEKVEVDAAEASGLLGVLEELATAAGQDTAADAPRPHIQTGTMPVSPYDTDGDGANPPRRFPDPAWPAPAPCDEVGLTIEPLWRTGLKHAGAVAQMVDGRMLLAVVGEDQRTAAGPTGTRAGASVLCASAEGGVHWRRDFAQPGAVVHTGPWPALVDLSGKGEWAVSVFVLMDGGEGTRTGTIHVYDARTGALRWQHQTQLNDAYPGGNGSCAAADLDGDGRIELVYGLCNQVLCLDAASGQEKWRYEDRIKICHGRFALADVDDDGLPEVIVATEYADDPADPDGDRSSILTLDGRGRLLRRLSNIQGDLGSTPIIALDADGDGKPEIVHGSENLVYHEPRHMAQLFILERWLTPKLDPVPTGGARLAVGDVDGDGAPEAVGITSYRDGGPHVRPEVFCVRVRDSRVKWRTPVPRVWLDGDPILADVDGDGLPEIIVTANYPSGYMHEPGTQPWCDLYILKGDGRILYQHTLPDAAVSPIAVDIDGDGRVEVLVPCYDGQVHGIRTPGPAQASSWPLVCHDAQRTGHYR